MLELTDKEFVALTAYLKDNYGINLTQKRVLVDGRLTNYLIGRGFESYTKYLETVKSDKTGHELEQLLNRVTTNHTYFMREAEHFSFFANKVLPELSKSVRDKSLRIWCAASSTGEEPYTLQMIMHDFFGSNKPDWDTKLLATDISERALQHCRNGIYSDESLKEVPEKWKTKYFTKADAGNFQIKDAIKKDMEFRNFNLMDNMPWKKPFHVIFCRNVMIYFDAPTKSSLINRFYDILLPGGYLFVGLTESLQRGGTRFNFVQPSIYQK